MNESVIRKTNLVGAWSGIAYVVLLLVGWWVVGGYFPMHKPSASAEEIAGFYHQHDVISIRLGMIIVMWGAAAFIPFTSTIADFIARFEGRKSGHTTNNALLRALFSDSRNFEKVTLS